MKTSCQAHCRSCDCHFSGTTAFDLHRKDFECVDPEKIDDLHPYTSACVISGMKQEGMVTVWSTVAPT